jgi:hypothetical protein
MAMGLATWLVLAPGSALASPSPLAWASPVPIDAQPPYAYSTEVSGVSCPSASLCVAVDEVGDVLVSSDPAGGTATWVRSRVAETLNAVSCPSTGLCVAVGNGVIAVSTDPAGGAAAWSTARVGMEGTLLKAVSCASASLCVATEGDSGQGEVWTSSDPSGGAGAWSEVKIAEDEEGVGGVSCPTSKLCVAVGSGYGGNVFTSTDPTAGAGAWTAAKIDSQRLYDVSCPSERLCVATDNNGDVLSSTEPTGGAGAWSSAKVGGLLEHVSCASWGFCVALDGGEAITSADPTGGPAAWSATPIANSPSLDGASCPAMNLCVLVDSDSKVVTSTEPTAEAGAWRITPLEVGHSDLRGVSCASVDLCVWVDDAGNVVSSTDPTAGASAWIESHVDAHRLDGVSCPSAAFCVAVDEAGNVVTSTDPTAGAGAWSVTNVDAEIPLKGISCASVNLCVAIDREGHAVASDNPTGGASAWHVSSLGDSFLGGVSCPSERYCIVTDSNEVLTSIDPSEGRWIAQPAASFSLGAISCSTVSLCVAVGSGAEAIVAWSEPTAHGPSWSQAGFELNPLSGTSCAAGGGLCMVTSVGGNGANGDVIYSYEPAGGAEAWGKSNVYGVPFEPPGGHLNFFEDDVNGVACVAQGMCIVGDRQNRVMVAVPQFATAPENTSPPVLEGTPTVGEALSCTTGAWTGEPAPILTEQWLRNGAPIPGATAGTYAVQAADEGDSVACEVTAANGAGRKSTISNTLHVQTAQGVGGGGSGGGSSGGGSSVGGGSSNKGDGSQGELTGTASNAFVLDDMEIVAAHGTIRLTLTLPAPGTLQIVSETASAQLASHKKKRRTLLVARARLTVSKAGRISVTLAPTGETKRMLSKQGKLKATLIITYTRAGGTARSIYRTVTFRMKLKKSRG